MQSQEMLQAFVDVAAQIEEKQFTEELPFSSVRRIIFKMYKSHLPEDATGDSCCGDENLYEINKRYVKVLPVCLGCVLEKVTRQECCH